METLCSRRWILIATRRRVVSLGGFGGNTTETKSETAKEDETQPRKLLKRIGGGAKKSAQTKLGKGILVAVASALLGVALLPFK